MIYALCLILFVIGLFGVLVKKNIIKIVMGFIIMEYAVNMFLLLLGYRRDGVAPIISRDTDIAGFVQHSVDPLMQAVVLSSIVVGLGIVILLVAIAIRLYEKYGTFDITKMRRLKG